MPIHPVANEAIDPHDSTQWMTYEVASSWVSHGFELGFVITAKDPFFCLDIDHALVEGSWSPLAMELVNATAGCLVEVSRSGEGLHIWGCSDILHERCKNTKLGIELYTQKRFIAFTDNVGDGGSESFEPDLSSIVNNYFSTEGGGSVKTKVEWIDAPRGAIQDDGELVLKMLDTVSTRNAFGMSASFKDLWTKSDVAVSQHNDDGSSMDMALCNYLAFWTGKNPVRMQRLFEMSDLVRDKWLKREEYRRWTIEEAILNCDNVYKQEVQIDDTLASGNIDAPISIREGYQYLGEDMLPVYFQGCCYVSDVHCVLTPRGDLLKPEKFKAVYGGYDFLLTNAGSGKTTQNAFQAFTESQLYKFPKVNRMCFRPEVPTGKVFEEQGYTMVNSYVDVKMPKRSGDASPFVNHIKTMLPNGRDAEILFCYLAACVQHKGVKFQWSPVIQGAEGTGKTMIFYIMSECLGDRYTALPNAQEIGGKFNGWAENKLFIFIDEVKVPSHRLEMLEALKPLITNSKLAIERKGVDSYTGDNRANTVLATNYRDGITVNVDTRRYSVLFGAQQTAEEVQAAGWTNVYFQKLYNWLKNDGYAIVHDYLATYAIAEDLNPAGLCQRAPETTSTNAAIELTRGTVEQEILEAIGAERLGFCGNYISAFHLNLLLQDTRSGSRISHNKRRELMESLGYVRHPMLNNGRANRMLECDNNSKSVIYVNKLSDAYVSKTPVDDYLNANSNRSATRLALVP